MTRFPKALQSLTLGHNFDQPLDKWCLGDGEQKRSNKNRAVNLYGTYKMV